MRITAACPEAMIADANNLSMVLAAGPADGETYRGLNWQDANGNRYAAASWEATEEWIAKAEGPLVRPDWDTGPPYVIDMEAAGRAQAALVVWLGGDDPAPQAAPEVLTAVGGIGGPEALAAMGLTMVEVEV
jgi:hypothetical protein